MELDYTFYFSFCMLAFTFCGSKSLFGTGGRPTTTDLVSISYTSVIVLCFTSEIGLKSRIKNFSNFKIYYINKCFCLVIFFPFVYFRFFIMYIIIVFLTCSLISCSARGVVKYCWYVKMGTNLTISSIGVYSFAGGE